MKRDTACWPLPGLLAAVLMLGACGGGPESGEVAAEGNLGTQQAALCSGSSVSALAIVGASSYQGELAGSGTWTATYSGTW